MNFGQNMQLPELILVYTLTIWSLIWKGIALWRAVKLSQRNWFIVILILNTVGILEILYLFRFAKKRMTWAEIKHWFEQTFFSRNTSK